ncbi:blue copper protein-like [Chenopodium quinoa]|uniref:Phytocyanin domain-containing protein n=1 Tax=Chenopodium quinoa TaxID=63459 RepID=A0A803L3X8_CHEQI|nr:blue copper protein-like [Chenopodium quinoa]
MKQRILASNNNMLCFALFFLCLILQEIPSIEAYKNYTVGDSLGWYDKSSKSSVDYEKWVSGKSFSLGDFLIFNTDSNHTVIQTFNSTTYTSCDSQGDDNVQWSSTAPNSTVVRPITVAVPLMKEGVSYFFSGDYDGEQCMNGQKFSINVTHGKGLPPSLKNNPDFAVGPGPTPATGADAAPGPDNPDSGDDQSAPDTIISSDFNHPKNVPEDSTSGGDEDDDDAKKSNNVAGFLPNWKMFFASLIGGVLLLL